MDIDKIKTTATGVSFDKVEPGLKFLISCSPADFSSRDLIQVRSVVDRMPYEYSHAYTDLRSTLTNRLGLLVPLNL